MFPTKEFVDFEAIIYANPPDWKREDGGALRIYPHSAGLESCPGTVQAGAIAAFVTVAMLSLLLGTEFLQDIDFLWAVLLVNKCEP